MGMDMQPHEHLRGRHPCMWLVSFSCRTFSTSLLFRFDHGSTSKQGIAHQHYQISLFAHHGRDQFPCCALWLDSPHKCRREKKIKGNHQTFDLPVLHQTKYLGTLISYGSFEDATTKLRVSHARLAFTRLKKWLTARRGLAVKERMRLWSTCVFPVLTYGIFTVGLTKKGLQMLQQTMITMIRQIHHDHASQTGRSHEHALLFHGVTPPLLWLWTTADSLFTSLSPSCISIRRILICARRLIGLLTDH